MTKFVISVTTFWKSQVKKEINVLFLALFSFSWCLIHCSTFLFSCISWLFFPIFFWFSSFLLCSYVLCFLFFLVTRLGHIFSNIFLLSSFPGFNFICGFLNFWIFSFPSFLVSWFLIFLVFFGFKFLSFMVFWIIHFPIFWFPYFLVSWFLGFLISSWIPDFLVSWCSGYLTSCFQIFVCGFLFFFILWFFVFLVSWFLKSWFYGCMVSRISYSSWLTLFSVYFGSRFSWFPFSFVSWFSGFLGSFISKFSYCKISKSNKNFINLQIFVLGLRIDQITRIIFTRLML